MKESVFMTIFYDTCSLLSELYGVFDTEEKFYISDITLVELEGIKTASYKDEETKYNARLLLHLLEQNEDKYEIILHTLSNEEKIKELNLPINNDSRIISDALFFYEKLDNQKDFIFKTKDLACKALAKAHGLPVEYLKTKEEEYTGFQDAYFTEAGLAKFY